MISVGIRTGVAHHLPIISFFPIAYLLNTGSSQWIGMLTPLVAVYCTGAAALIFSRGLRRYENAGN